jgi:hypothetical protein
MVINRYVRQINFARGTKMLAIKTIAARAHEPDVNRKTIPLMIVSFCSPKRDPVSMIGSIMAGPKRRYAERRYAHERSIDCGFRN